MPSAKEISQALARIRAAMPAAKKVDGAHRNIKLGLERISRVVPQEQKWVGVHVGGTNGKGSVCTMLSGLLRLAGLGHGMYTSPAIPDRHCGVMINGLYVNPRMYEAELRHVEDKFKRVASGWRFTASEDPGDLTPFELETAAAFRVFDKMHVQYGIVEVGMGGATDATNIMRQKAVTVITKIDLDHQEYLGNTIEEIAKVKAGIMRPGVPCIVDHTNSGAVLKVLREHANKIGTQISPSWKGQPLIETLDKERFQLEEYQKQNLLCAVLAFRHLFPNLEIDVNRLLATHPYPPGRKERVGVVGLTNGLRQTPVLVDGAHNLLGVEALSTYVEKQIRQGDEPVTWVMGLSASKTKPFAKLIETLIRPHDNFAFVEYAPGPNEPPPVPAELGREMAQVIVKDKDRLYDGEPTVGDAVRWACLKAGEGPVVVTGSLYLIRNLYRLSGVQRRRAKTRRPGLAQLWRYTQIARERPLTVEEEKEFKKARRHWYLSPHRKVPVMGGEVKDPELVADLQRQADFHKRQADGYGEAIRSASRDIDKAATDANVEKPEEAIATLRASIKELSLRKHEHLRIYNTSMFRLRGYIPDPEKKFMTYEELFGRPPRRKKGKLASTDAAPLNDQDARDGAHDDTGSISSPESLEDIGRSDDASRSGSIGTAGGNADEGAPGKKEQEFRRVKASVRNKSDLVAEADDLVNNLTSNRRL